MRSSISVILSRITSFFGFATLTMLLGACYPIYRDVKLYDGPSVPPEKTAELRVHKDATRLHSIDGKEVKFTTYDMFDALKVKLAPGSHTVNVSYYYPHRKSGGVVVSGHTQLSKNSHNLSFSAISGHKYIVRTPFVKLGDDILWCPFAVSTMDACSSEVGKEVWHTSIVDITDPSNEVVVVSSRQSE
jgi:hypothetical protein